MGKMMTHMHKRKKNDSSLISAQSSRRIIFHLYEETSQYICQWTSDSRSPLTHTTLDLTMEPPSPWGKIYGGIHTGHYLASPFYKTFILYTLIEAPFFISKIQACLITHPLLHIKESYELLFVYCIKLPPSPKRKPLILVPPFHRHSNY